MAILNREGLLKALELKSETVPLPSGGEVVVTGLNAAEYLEVYTRHKEELDASNRTNFNRSLVIACVVDDKNNRLLTEEDADALLQPDCAAYSALLAACYRVNSLGDLTKN